MEPKDLKNSNNELQATSENGKVAPMHMESQDTDGETEKIQAETPEAE
jgi:hypothetical protein